MTTNEIDHIIRDCSGGELAGFSDMYQKYGGLVRSVLFKLCDPEDIDDLVQEAFMRIWKGLPKFNQKSSLKTWVYRITSNLAIDNLRKRKRVSPAFELNEEIIEGKSEDMTDKDLVQKSLGQLGEDHRQVLVLSCMEGLTNKEIADVAGVPEGTVKSRLHHAKSKIYGILKDKGVSL